MLRQLLTLFAVISGFALVAEPARAVDADIVSMAQAGEQGDCATITSAPLQLASGKAASRNNPRPCSGRPVVVFVPSVQLQADRARE